MQKTLDTPVLQPRMPLETHSVDWHSVSQPQTPRQPTARPVEAMLLALATPSRNKSALPHVHRTLPQAELFHQVIVGRVGRGQRVDCPELTGHDRCGQPLTSGHRHGHVLPLDLDGDQHLDHILIWAPMGLGDAAQRAIRSLKRVREKRRRESIVRGSMRRGGQAQFAAKTPQIEPVPGGFPELQVALVGRSDLGALENLPEPLRGGIARCLANEPNALASGRRNDGRANEQVDTPSSVQDTPAASAVGSRSWISLTRFVPPRFVKRRGRNTLEGQVLAELESRGLPPAAQVEVLPDESIALRHFVRVRRHGGSPPPVDVGYALRITWNEPVPAPLLSDTPVISGSDCSRRLALEDALPERHRIRQTFRVGMNSSRRDATATHVRAGEGRENASRSDAVPVAGRFNARATGNTQHRKRVA